MKSFNIHPQSQVKHKQYELYFMYNENWELRWKCFSSVMCNFAARSSQSPRGCPAHHEHDTMNNKMKEEIFIFYNLTNFNAEKVEQKIKWKMD